MDYLLGHPLAALVVTFSAYTFANWLHVRTGQHALTTPIMVAIAMVSIFILLSGIGYETYMEGGQYLHFLLGPATVALAIPLYRQINQIGRQARAIIVSLIIAFVVTPLLVIAIAKGFSANNEITLAMTLKSVTTPIAIGISEETGVSASMAVFFVTTTGVFGAMFGFQIIKMAGIKDPRAAGFAMGVCCHGIGTARAFLEGEKQGVYSVLGMCVMGLVSGLLLPVLILGVKALGWF